MFVKYVEVTFQKPDNTIEKMNFLKDKTIRECISFLKEGFNTDYLDVTIKDIKILNFNKQLSDCQEGKNPLVIALKTKLKSNQGPEVIKPQPPSIEKQKEIRSLSILNEKFDSRILDSQQMAILSPDSKEITYQTLDGSIRCLIEIKDQKSDKTFPDISITQEFKGVKLSFFKNNILGVLVTWNNGNNQAGRVFDYLP